jgi:hypothetical protein
MMSRPKYEQGVNQGSQTQTDYMAARLEGHSNNT